MAEQHRSDVETSGSASAAESACAAGHKAPDEMQLRREARRRVLAGGLASAPLVLTLTSRSAFASHCSASGGHSGNTSSAHDDVVCLGNTPGYWKTHEPDFSQWAFPGTCNPITEKHGQCSDYTVPSVEELTAYIEEMKKNEHRYAWKIPQCEEYLEKRQTSYPEPDWFFGTLFSEIFGDGYTDEPEITLMQALWLEDTPAISARGTGGSAPVLAHSVAAWLNANEFGPEAYGMSPDKVVELVQTLIHSDPIGLKETLEMLNSRGG